MTTIGLPHYLAVGAALFALGMVTVVTRRNAVGILMGVELILNAANVNFIAFNHFVDCKAAKEECIASWKRDAAPFLVPLGKQNIDGLLGYYLDKRLNGPARDKYCAPIKSS